MTALRIEALGDGALLLRLGERIDGVLNDAAHALAAALRAADLPGIVDIAPAYASVALRYDAATWADRHDGESAHARVVRRVTAVASAWSARAAAPDGPVSGTGDAAVIEIPVCYGGEFGVDLDAVAAHAGIDAGEVVVRHVRPVYRVAMLGFMPGFPYLLGLDPILQAQRRASPRPRVPAGSVAIGGAQTGIYPRELPGGWQLIGRTPLVLFDAQREPPALLRPGQRLRFRAIDAATFATLAR